MKAILALTGKDLKLILRDRWALFWIIAFPLLYSLFFGAIFGGGGDEGRGSMSIAIVDEDATAESRALIERLAGHESVAADREGPGQSEGAGEGVGEDVAVGDGINVAVGEGVGVLV